MKDTSARFTQLERQQPRQKHTWYDTTTTSGTMDHMTHTIHLLIKHPDTKSPTFAILPDTHEQAKEWNKALRIQEPSEKLRRLKDITLQITIAALAEAHETDEAHSQDTSTDTHATRQDYTTTTTTTTTSTTPLTDPVSNTTHNITDLHHTNTTSTTSPPTLRLGKTNTKSPSENYNHQAKRNQSTS